MTLSLNNSDRDEFLYIQKNLILFTSKKFKIYNKFQTMKDMEQGILTIRKKMYDADNIKDFCEQSDSLDENQKSIVQS